MKLTKTSTMEVFGFGLGFEGGRGGALRIVSQDISKEYKNQSNVQRPSYRVNQ